MLRIKGFARFLFVVSILLSLCGLALGQRSNASTTSEVNSDFGPVMRAYLGYLGNEQEVVDDRNSRREITAAYYRRNSNRIRALRMMAVRLVRQTGNDYVPELEAVTLDELSTLFERPPRPSAFRVNEILDHKFRYLGLIQAGEQFYLFARLDPYEQAELMQRQPNQAETMVRTSGPGAAAAQRISEPSTRPRRTVPR
ncbi:MAG: hypothetical protein AABM67_15580 [Acidobacteriota bacterium]